MTECRQSQRLSAYYDGELSAASRAGMEEHVRGCPQCAAELARMRSMSQLIRAAGRAEMPAEALRRLHLSADLQPKITLVHTAEVLAAVAAAILLFSGVWLWRIAAARDAAAQIPVWETVAVAGQDPSGVAAAEPLAQWIVQDLSRNNGND
jgi:anti-sigma factor RsiW